LGEIFGQFLRIRPGLGGGRRDLPADFLVRDLDLLTAGDLLEQ
jgi:hypothetical protein